MRHQPLNSEAVRDAAAALGIDSVSELARRSGIPQSTLTKILRGDRAAQPSHVATLAETLSVDRSTLLHEEASV